MCKIFGLNNFAEMTDQAQAEGEVKRVVAVAIDGSDNAKYAFQCEYCDLHCILADFLQIYK